MDFIPQVANNSEWAKKETVTHFIWPNRIGRSFSVEETENGYYFFRYTTNGHVNSNMFRTKSTAIPSPGELFGEDERTELECLITDELFQLVELLAMHPDVSGTTPTNAPVATFAEESVGSMAAMQKMWLTALNEFLLTLNRGGLNDKEVALIWGKSQSQLSLLKKGVREINPNDLIAFAQHMGYQVAVLVKSRKVIFKNSR